MADHFTPGLALALLLPDGRLEVRTYGVADVRTNAPMVPETLFQIGSISKTFTGIAFSQLIDEGRFDPQAPITDALPWFRLDSDFAPITGHHLLTHTAGLPVNRDDIVGSHYMAWALRDQRPVFPPGERVVYSNMGYQVLHATLETLEGQPVREIFRRRIFEPLAMHRSQAGFTHGDRHRLATGYQPRYDDRPWHPSHGLVEAPWHEYDVSDGNVVSNVTELSRFLRMLLNRGEGTEGSVLSPAAFGRFLGKPGLPAFGDPRQHYGYGITVSHLEGGVTHIDHSGGMLGHVSNMVGNLDTGHGTVVLGNALDNSSILLGAYALSLLEAQAAGEPLPRVPPPIGDRQRIANAAEYAGVFESPADGRTFHLRAEDDALHLLSSSLNPPTPVVLERHERRDHFYVRHPDLELFLLRFGRDADGQVVEIFHGGDWFVGEHYQGARHFETPASWDAFPGHYRSYSPWLSNFRVFLRKGDLVLETVAGPESSDGFEVLKELEPGLFQMGEGPTSERLQFDAIADGRALRAVYSGHPLYRVFTP